MGIPSLMTLSLSVLCLRLPPEERPKMRQTLKGIFDKHNYSAIFRVFDQMDYCLHCDNWTSSTTDEYHHHVVHPTLLGKANCDCRICRDGNIALTSPRLCLCVRCKESYHFMTTEGGMNCDIDPDPTNQEPYYLSAGYGSNHDGSTFILTHRAPSYIVEWMQAIANEKYDKHTALRGQGGFRGRGTISPNPTLRKKKHPIRWGHALCDRCADEMLLIGQMRWQNQRNAYYPSLAPAFCEGCSHGFQKGVNIIVVRRVGNTFQFGADYIVDSGPFDWAFFQYQPYNNAIITTVYVPKFLHNDLYKYLEHGTSICFDCFNQIKPDLQIIDIKL